ncbi:NUDIX hydrolase [Legionella brunensis]|uniref:MutT/nudix family transporter protein n=1 Tax=Legionella brunensis TaxID=29422 RepID=A0A0W0STL6_9GAMM|nr:CoA pyrophosphatase [Legionella brunensis]KTC86712.1 MutT/nudix family transporter protein [Legionella brunensis]
MGFETLDKTVLRRTASVLVLHDLSNDSLILTQRSLKLRHHPGEVCFPGGRWQEGDESLYATALRELHEELGIPSLRVKSPMAMAPERTLTGFLIYPWYASLESLLPYFPDSNEVIDVFNLPMDEVKNIKHYQEIVVTRDGLHIKSCQYTASSHFVWGATARIMKQLCTQK